MVQNFTWFYCLLPYDMELSFCLSTLWTVAWNLAVVNIITEKDMKLIEELNKVLTQAEE